LVIARSPTTQRIAGSRHSLSASFMKLQQQTTVKIEPQSALIGFTRRVQHDHPGSFLHKGENSLLGPKKGHLIWRIVLRFEQVDGQFPVRPAAEFAGSCRGKITATRGIAAERPAARWGRCATQVNPVDNSSDG
jgi:hypothetical protein